MWSEENRVSQTDIWKETKGKQRIKTRTTTTNAKMLIALLDNKPQDKKMKKFLISFLSACRGRQMPNRTETRLDLAQEGYVYHKHEPRSLSGAYL